MMTTKTCCICAFITVCSIVSLDIAAVHAQQNDGADAKYVGLNEAEAAQLERTVNALIRAVGVVESASVTMLQASAGGTIVELVPEGITVKKGDQIAQLDSSQIKEEFATQSMTVASAIAAALEADVAIKNKSLELQMSEQIGIRQIEVAQLRFKAIAGDAGELAVQELDISDQIKAAEKMCEAQRITLNRARKDPMSVPDAEAKMARAMTELAMLKRKRELHSLIRELKSAELSLEIEEQKAQLTMATAAMKSELNQSEAIKAAAEQAKEVEQSKHAALQKKLDGLVLTAPQDGIVVYPSVRRGEDPLEPGKTVRERQPIAQIADMSELQVAVLVNETQVGRVRVGQKATVQIDAFPGREFMATVTQINRTPEPTTFLDSGGKKYRVALALKQPVPSFRLGMTAQVDIDATN